MSATNTRNSCRFLAGALFTTWVAISANAQTPGASPKFSPDLPTRITTPDTVETRIGTLRYQDGTPDAATV